jgi:hypothetical protein
MYNNSEDADPTFHEHMVEPNTLFNKGKKTGAIDNDAIMVGVPQGFKLMEAPPSTSKQGYSLIFWEPSSIDDRTPEFEKVVSTAIRFCMTVHEFSSGGCLHPWG